MPVMMSPGATVLLRRLSGSSTDLTVALISIPICAWGIPDYSCNESYRQAQAKLFKHFHSIEG
jgi:hypothetical protein